MNYRSVGISDNEKDRKMVGGSGKSGEHGFNYGIFLATRLREQVLAFIFQLCKLTVGICLGSCSYHLLWCNIWAPT